MPCLRPDAAVIARRYPHALVRRGDRPSGAYRLRTAYPGRGAVGAAAWYYDPTNWRLLPPELEVHYRLAVAELEQLRVAGMDATSQVLELWARGARR